MEDGKKRMGEETVDKQACPAILTFFGRWQRAGPTKASEFELWQDEPRDLEGERQADAFGSK